MNSVLFSNKLFVSKTNKKVVLEIFATKLMLFLSNPQCEKKKSLAKGLHLQLKRDSSSPFRSMWCDSYIMFSNKACVLQLQQI